jgi:RNA polymerase sigma factor (sigma-70 family)
MDVALTELGDIARRDLPMIVATVRGALGRRFSEADVEEVASDVLEQIHRGLPGFNAALGEARGRTPGQQQRIWIRRIAANRAHTFARDRRREERRIEIVPAPTHDLAQHPDANRTPEESAVHRQRLDFCLSLVEQLAPALKSVFVLHTEGLQSPEIAEIEGVSEGTVRKRLAKARTSLAAAIRRHQAKQRRECAAVLPFSAEMLERTIAGARQSLDGGMGERLMQHVDAMRGAPPSVAPPPHLPLPVAAAAGGLSLAGGGGSVLAILAGLVLVLAAVLRSVAPPASVGVAAPARPPVLTAAPLAAATASSSAAASATATAVAAKDLPPATAPTVPTARAVSPPQSREQLRRALVRQFSHALAQDDLSSACAAFARYQAAGFTGSGAAGDAADMARLCTH